MPSILFVSAAVLCFLVFLGIVARLSKFKAAGTLGMAPHHRYLGLSAFGLAAMACIAILVRIWMSSDGGRMFWAPVFVLFLLAACWALLKLVSGSADEVKRVLSWLVGDLSR